MSQYYRNHPDEEIRHDWISAEPIAPNGIVWAIGQINKQLEKSLKPKTKEEVLEKPEPHKASENNTTEEPQP